MLIHCCCLLPSSLPSFFLPVVSPSLLLIWAHLHFFLFPYGQKAETLYIKDKQIATVWCYTHNYLYKLTICNYNNDGHVICLLRIWPLGEIPIKCPTSSRLNFCLAKLMLDNKWAKSPWPKDLKTTKLLRQLWPLTAMYHIPGVFIFYSRSKRKY